MTEFAEEATSGAEERPTVITWPQRQCLVEALTVEAQREHERATQLDQSFAAEMADVDATDPEYDRRARAVDDAYDAAATLEDLRWAFDEAKVISLHPPVETDPASAVARALVAAWATGRDVGEVLVDGVAQAQRLVYSSREEPLTMHRPGSWEAALLDEIINASRWERHGAGEAIRHA